MAPRTEHWILATVCLLAVAAAAGAVAPEDTTYQGRLLDSLGDPLAGPVDIEIGVWDSPAGGTQLYYEFHQNVPLTDGVFSVLIGTGQLQSGSFDADLFAAENRYLEVVVDTEVLDPRQPFSSVAYALQSGESDTAIYADTAGDADTVDGSHAASLNQSAHVSATGNPHGVTAAQVGAATSSQLASHEADASAHHAKTMSFAELSDMAADAQIPDSITIIHAANADTVDGQHATAFGSATQVASNQSDIATNQSDIAGLQATVASQQAAISTLQAQVSSLQELLQHVSRSGDDIYFTGANLHVRSGEGVTAAFNGLGNLIVGYNELRGDGTDNRTGSHNIVVGGRHNYAVYSGLVVGDYNSITGPFSSVTGGFNNTASGWHASVSGGMANTASGSSASVSGGFLNTASGDAASASGGRNNKASGHYSFVGGGGSASATYGNEAFAQYSAILGGIYNIAGDPARVDHAIGERATISGGDTNRASGIAAHVSGGRGNVASGDYSFVGGGGHDNPLYGNTAYSHYSAILGGEANVAGDEASGDPALAQRATVTGGNANVASGPVSHVSGGRSNVASGWYSVVSGGNGVTASTTDRWSAPGYLE